MGLRCIEHEHRNVLNTALAQNIGILVSSALLFKHDALHYHQRYWFRRFVLPRPEGESAYRALSMR